MDAVVGNSWAHQNPDGTWNMAGETRNADTESSPLSAMFVCEGEREQRQCCLGERAPMFRFQTDPQMLAIAEQVASTVQLQQCADDPQGGHHCVQTQPKAIVGRSGVTGPASWTIPSCGNGSRPTVLYSRPSWTWRRRQSIRWPSLWRACHCHPSAL